MLVARLIAIHICVSFDLYEVLIPESMHATSTNLVIMRKSSYVSLMVPNVEVGNLLKMKHIINIS